MQRSKQLDLYKPTITKWINDSLAASRGGAAAAVSSGPVPWSNVSKAGSSIADLESHSHGLLSDLTGTDHHTQYVHVSSPRTITAQHAFNAGLTSSDADLQFAMGRALVGNVGHSDYAGFAHRDWATASNYALLQDGADGDTFLNTPTGRTIFHRVNNVDAMVMSATELTVNSVTALRTSSFTSGFTGNGFRIDNGVLTAGRTTAELDDLIVRGRMRVYELLVQQIRATNGSIFVSSTGKVKTVTGSGPYSIETDATHGFLVNDLIRAQRFTGNGVYQSNLQVTAVADTTHFTATLSSGDAPAAGMEFVRLGNTSDSTRQNSIYMSADDTYNPFIDLIVGVNSFAAWGSTSTRKGRIGNLQGLFSVANELGIFVGDGTGVSNKYLRISNLTQESHNIPNKMYDSDGNLFMQMDTSGLSYYVQSASSFADNTSILFRRPDGTKILRLVGVNDFGAHTGSLGVETGSSNSELRLSGAAPSGFFSRVIIQNSVGASSSQWIFQRLADGTARANFASHLVVDLNIGSGVVGNPTYKMQVSGGTTHGLAIDGAARFGQGGMWGAIDGPASAGWVGFGANFYYSSDTPKYRASNYSSMIFFSDGLMTFNTAASGTADATITFSERMRLSNAGNLGIGENNPVYRLHVKGNNTSGSYPIIKLQNTASGGRSWWLYSGANGVEADFGVYDETAGAYRMTINSSGQVSIGTDLLVSGVTRLAGGYAGLAEAAEPSTSAVYGYLFIDSADGDLKVKFKNGTVKTLATN